MWFVILQYIGSLPWFKTLTCMQSRIKGYGRPGQFSLEGPYDVFHDVIVAKFVFAD